MGELDELPSWAGRSASEVTVPGGELPNAAAGNPDPSAQPSGPPPVEPPRRSRLSRLLLPLLGLALLIGAGAVGYFLASRNSDTTEATAAETDADTTDEATTSGDGSDDTDGAETEAGTDTDTETDADADGTDAETDERSTTEATTVTVEEEDTSADATGDDADASAGQGGAENMSERVAVFRGGKVYLSGAVPSQEVAEIIVSRAAAVVGPDNVVNEYVIDPTVEIQPGESAPLFVEDVVLFEFNSVAIAEPFRPILDLGVLLLSQNPQASVTVITRTDAVGSEDVNLDVATRRAQSVADYWVARGVDADQIVLDPRGEEGASEDDDAETAARQRRAEFIITGLLD